MAIKKLTFSFEVPITQLLGLIATGNTGLKIDVAGDEHPQKIVKALANGAAVKLLEGPKPNRSSNRSSNGIPSWQIMLRAFAANPDHTKATRDLMPLLTEVGLKKNSASPQLEMMKRKGWLKRIDKGVWQLTAKGAVEAGKLGFPVATPTLKRGNKKTETTEPHDG